MKAILIGAMTAATLALPVAAFAATYQYINVQGNLESETAASPEQALTQPTDISQHSGVILDTGAPLSLTPVAGFDAIAGTYVDQPSATSTTDSTMYLTLDNGGAVILSTIYGNSEAPVIESGTWTETGTNQITVTLTGSMSGSTSTVYSPAHVMTLDVNGSTLTAVNYNQMMYGSNGLTFTK
jgi:hypothetical protein